MSTGSLLSALRLRKVKALFCVDALFDEEEEGTRAKGDALLALGSFFPPPPALCVCLPEGTTTFTCVCLFVCLCVCVSVSFVCSLMRVCFMDFFLGKYSIHF